MLKIAALIGVSLLVTACVPSLVISGATTAGVVASQERTVGHAVDDLSIRTQILSKFIQKDVNDLLVNVDTHVTEGRVLLTGNVDHAETVVQAIRLTWQVPGVQEVINEIQVQQKGGWQAWLTDAWISNQIRTRLLFAKDIRSVNYNVETVHGVVYLMGIAMSQSELEKATYVASTTRYVKQVISHVRLKDDPRRAPYKE